MSKHLTRKGLAFGAIVALGTTLIAGAPASAAGISTSTKVTLAPTDGTSYTVLASDELDGASFYLKSSVASSVRGAATTGLKFLVTDLDQAVTDVDQDTNISGVSDFDATSKSFIVSGDDVTLQSTFGIFVDSADTHVVTVSSWFDDNGNDVIDTDEYVNTQAITFKKASEITATVAVTKPVVGDPTVEAVVTTSPALNENFSSNVVSVDFTHQGSADVFNETTYEYVASTGKYTFDHSFNVIAGTYSARAYIGGTAISSKVLATAVATTSVDGSVALAETSNINTWVYEGDDYLDAELRTGTLTFAPKFSFVDENDAAVSAGRRVAIHVDGVSSIDGLKINGTSVESGDVVYAYTDASGSVVATVSATKTYENSWLDIYAVAENVTATEEWVYAWWNDASVMLVDLNNSGSSTQRNIAKGGTYTFNFAITDAWSQKLTGDYRLDVVVGGNTVSEAFTSISSGTATVSVTDGKLATGNVSVDVNVQKKTDDVWATVETESYTLYPQDQTGVAVSATLNSTAVGIYSETLVAGDARTSQVAVTDNWGNYVYGYATDAVTGAAIPGALVTVTGPATVLFQSGDKAAFGSISVFANADGYYEVGMDSNIAQEESVITVSSVGATATKKVTFDAPTSAASVKDVVISAPTTLAPGRSVSLTISAIDKFGNVVNLGADDDDITVSSTGSGYLTAYPVVFTEGVANVVLITQPNDTGSAIITVVAALGALDSVKEVATVTIGAAPVAATAAASGSTAKIYASATNAAGKTVVVKVNGKTVKSFAGTAAKKTVVVAATAGAKNVSVFVGGVKVLGKVVTVK